MLPRGHREGLTHYLLRFFVRARARSGINSLTTLNTNLLPMVIPKLTAPASAECWLGGCQRRERKAPAATPPTWEKEKVRLPSSWRARRLLSTAYSVRGQNPFSPELK